MTLRKRSLDGGVCKFCRVDQICKTVGPYTKCVPFEPEEDCPTCPSCDCLVDTDCPDCHDCGPDGQCIDNCAAGQLCCSGVCTTGDCCNNTDCSDGLSCINNTCSSLICTAVISNSEHNHGVKRHEHSKNNCFLETNGTIGNPSNTVSSETTDHSHTVSSSSTTSRDYNHPHSYVFINSHSSPGCNGCPPTDYSLETSFYKSHDHGVTHKIKDTTTDCPFEFPSSISSSAHTNEHTHNQVLDHTHLTCDVGAFHSFENGGNHDHSTICYTSEGFVVCP